MPSEAVKPGPMRHIICMKWGTKYEPYYVNNLYAMARRHLTGEFRFICLTDDAKGIPSSVTQGLYISPVEQNMWA